MRFYRAIDPVTKRLRLFKRKDLAAKLDPDYTPFDCPVDSDGLMEVLQDLIDRGPPMDGSADAPQEAGEAPVDETTSEPVIVLPGSSPAAPDPKLRCPKCDMTQQGAQRIADMRVNQLFGDELFKLPNESIVRASEILTARLLEVARSTGTMLKP